MADPNDALAAPEESPVEEALPVETVEEEEYLDAPPRAIDPAFVFFIFLVIALIGLTNLAPDVRQTLLLSLLASVAVLAIILDKVAIEAPTVRNLLIGLGFGVLIGAPLLGVGAPQLQRLSQSIFTRLPESSVFQMLAITMPLAETLYFRGAFQSARGLIFASVAGGLWSLALFFPQLEVVKFPLVAVVIALLFVFINFIYSYLRERFGLYASWSCQIAVNLILLFVARYT